MKGSQSECNRKQDWKYKVTEKATQPKVGSLPMLAASFQNSGQRYQEPIGLPAWLQPRDSTFSLIKGGLCFWYERAMLGFLGFVEWLAIACEPQPKAPFEETFLRSRENSHLMLYARGADSLGMGV